LLIVTLPSCGPVRDLGSLTGTSGSAEDSATETAPTSMVSTSMASMTSTGGEGTTEDAPSTGASDTSTSSDSGGADLVVCGTTDEVFPQFDRTCIENEDCVVVVHQTDCCGNQVAWGLAETERDAFEVAEAECMAQMSACACPAGPIVADDGSSTWDPMTLTVGCMAGQCQSQASG
jgi:hypothetical protein